jgi:hypothetical protein
MSTHIDYTQIAAKLDYAAVEKKLEQLAQREPPRKRKTAVDVLEPLRERLLALHHKGWSSAQLVVELKAVGIPVSPACLRECLSRWTRGGNGAGKSRSRRHNKRNGDNARPTTAASQAGRGKSASGDSQSALRLPGH